MTIDFAHNARPTIGVEMELHLVDSDTGDLVSIANEVLDELGERHPDGEHPRAKHELFQSTVEIITDVHHGPDEIGADLRGTLDELRERLGPRNATVMSCATHPFALATNQLVSPDPRYHRLIETMQWPARRLLICGMHIHVGVPDGQQAITVINELLRHLPIFLALSSSSPFFEGEDSGMASARSLVFESLPTAGLPPQISEWSEFEDFMDTLIDTGCIDTVREVWWDVRPHPGFGTVELRMCDAMPTVHETVALAGLAQTLVAWCLERIADGSMPRPPTQWSVKQNRWLAARHGLSAELIVERPGSERVATRLPLRDVLNSLVDRLRPTAERLGTTASLDDALAMAETGSGADRQRSVVAAGGTLLDVVDHLVEELASDTPTRR